MLNTINSVLNSSSTKKLHRKPLKRNNKAPLFSLPNVDGEYVQFKTILSEDKGILVFYGSSWYRHAYFALLAWQEVLEYIGNQNTKILAIYPEEPNFATIVKCKSDQEIEVLCDVGNNVAKQFGLVVKVSSDKKRELLETIAIDIISLKSEEEIELTIPAIYVVNKDRTILHVSFDIDGHSCRNVKEILDYLT